MTIAFWCVLISGLLPYAAFALAAASLNPSLPRLAATRLEGLPARAHGAHLNAFEAFGFFAAAVIIAFLVEGASGWTNGLAIGFIIVRLGHMGFYLADISALRSACFALGMLLILAIFVQAALH